MVEYKNLCKSILIFSLRCSFIAVFIDFKHENIEINNFQSIKVELKNI